MTTILARAARPATLVVGALALALGTTVPAVAASPEGAGPISPTTAVRGGAAKSAASGVTLPVAKKAKKKPPRVKKPKLVKNGRRHHNVRISWPWVEGAARYIVQASPKKKFPKKKTTRVKRKNPRSRPAGGRVELTVPGLKNATTYRVRVRAVAPSGVKGRWSKVRKARTKVHIPNRITAMTATPGPKEGQVTFRWKHKRKYTSHYVLDLAATTFHPQGKNLPKKGRNHLRIKIPAKKKKFVLSAARAARVGARAASGNHIYFRFSAVNKNKGEKKTRLLPNLRAVQPAGPAVAAASSTTDVRFGTYNLAYVQGARDWDARAARIAKSIVDHDIDVIGVQELAPGNSNMQRRPTQQIVDELRAASKGRHNYAITRATSFQGSGGSQGARILYDADRFALVGTCPDHNGSTACTIATPGPPGVGPRMASYARFKDLRSQHGTEFWFVSVHLTPDGKNGPQDALRKRQVQHVVGEIERMNADRLPIVLTGDLNSWQNRGPGNPPHDFLVGHGFVDTFAAPRKSNEEYSTYNKWDTNVKKYGQGFGVRLDYVLVKGGAGVLRWENVMKPHDPARDSDHNLVVSDVRLPVPR